MSHVTELAISRALAMLNAVGAKYKIILPDGAEHGELEVVVPRERKRHKGPYEYGALQKYFVPFIGEMKPGQSVDLPCDRFDLERLRSAVSAYAVSHWGKGSAITATDKDKRIVEILRIL